MSVQICRRWCVCSAVVLALSGCAMFAPSEREKGDLPVVFESGETGVVSTSDWWVAFGDEQLNGLVAKALAGNLSLEQADARLRQAEAMMRKSRADRIPSVSGNAKAEQTTRDGDGDRDTTENYSLGLTASYELDLWGRVSSGYRASEESFNASLFDFQSAAMSVAGETAKTYFEWQALSAKKRLLESQLESRKKMLSVMEKRFESAQANALAVLQQREKVAAAEAALTPVSEQIDVKLNALAVLIGELPQKDLGLVASDEIKIPEQPAAGLPADLLAQRPDVAAAWSRLAASDWNVSAARANRMPKITLTGSVTTSDESIDGLFDNWVENLAAGLVVPLIDGGSRRAEVLRNEAISDELFAKYRSTVLTALNEVENALSANVYQQVYVAAVERQLVAATASAEESLSRYTRGLDSYFEALDEEVSKESLEISLLQARYDLLADRVQLFRVLGGDWNLILTEYRADSALLGDANAN